ncbi:hypothetical protein ACPV5U_23565 [Vibrio mediterranei]
MKDELMKLLFIGVVLSAVIGVIFLSRWFDVPLSVMMHSVFIELFALAIAAVAIMLRVKENLSFLWTSPLFIAAVYSGFTPLMNYKAMPFHNEILKLPPEFYGQSWFHISVIVLILFIGYGLIFYKYRNSW